jgi:bifunctional DNase/RNase
LQNVPSGPDPERHVERADIALQIREAIAGLPAGQREAVSLFYLAGLTHAEIADELGTQPSAVKTRLHKARRSLRAPLTELWKEHFAMPGQTEHLVSMRIADVRRTARAEPDNASHIVFLDEVDGDRRLPIWIGPGEATALAVIIEDVELPRPLVYQFTAALLRAARGQLREVRIVELPDSTFYAQAVLTDGTAIDARPSDVLPLAVVMGVPIYGAPAVLEQAATHWSRIGDLLEEADRAEAYAHTMASETKTRIEAVMAEARERTDR